MYRRAMAALALGKKDLAYWELCIAAEIDPKSQEVAIKLQEINSSLNNDHSHQYSQNDGPVSLGMSLPVPKKKIEQSPKQDGRVGNDESVVNDGGIAMKETQRAVDILKHINLMDESRVEKTQSFIEKNVKSGKDKKENEKELILKNEKVNKKQVEVEKEIKEQANMVNEIEMADVEIGSNCHGSNSKNANLVEFTCRYRNRRRPDSTLTISRRNYQKLKAGRTINCWNSRLGVWMSIRLLPGSEDEEKQQQEWIDEPINETTSSEGVQQNKDEVQDNQFQGDMIVKIEQFSSSEINVVLESSSEFPHSSNDVMEADPIQALEGGNSLVDAQNGNEDKVVVTMIKQGQYHRLARSVRKARMHKRRIKRSSTRQGRKNAASIATFVRRFHHH